MKKLILGSIAATFAFSSAMAADKMIPVPTAPAPTYYNWSGIYIGAHGGYAWDRVKGTNSFFSDLTDQRFSGGLGGAQIGINHQMGKVVLGLELSGSWSGASGTSDCFVSHLFITALNTVSCSASQDWSAQLLARLGYAPGDGRFLPYILGGVSMAQLKTSGLITLNGLLPVNTSAIALAGPWETSAVHQGAVLGFGAQYAVTPTVSVGLDYLYGIYGTQEHAATAPFTSVSNAGPPIGISRFSSAAFFNTPQSLTTHTTRFVINFKLD